MEEAGRLAEGDVLLPPDLKGGVRSWSGGRGCEVGWVYLREEGLSGLLGSDVEEVLVDVQRQPGGAENSA